jgi:hypothetical protein
LSTACLATPSPRLEAQALAVVQEGLDRGRSPTLARSHTRMLHVYELMFWNTLAEHADLV